MQGAAMLFMSREPKSGRSTKSVPAFLERGELEVLLAASDERQRVFFLLCPRAEGESPEIVMF